MAIQPKPALKKLVVVENAVLASLATVPALTKQFPFLAQLVRRSPPKAKKKGECGGCGGSSQKQVDFDSARRQLVALPESKRRIIKQQLKTEKLQVRVQNGGKITKYTF